MYILGPRVRSPQARGRWVAKLLSISTVAILVATPEMHAQTCVQVPPGLVGWWRAEGNGNDALGVLNGTLQNGATFGVGKVGGQAFSFNGTNSTVSLGNPASLQLQTFTIEAWVKRSSTNQASFGGDGVIFGYGNQGYILGMVGDGSPFLSQVGSSSVIGSQKITDADFYHHVAVTRNGSVVVFYVDGVAYPAPSYNPTFNFGTSVAIGALGSGGNSFLGLIDEVSVYSRDLSAAEIQAVYNAGQAGKCVSSVIIIAHPTDQAATLGNNATFSVTAGGTPQPLAYQWRLNNTNLTGANSPTLTISNVQLTNAGNYSVLVTNAAGSAVSSNAVLTVNAATCVPPLQGLVGWWKAEGNGNDVLGVLNGSLQNGATFGAGKVGQAFSFDGNVSAVSLGNPTNLQLQTFTIESWIRRTSTNQASLSPGGGSVFGYGNNGYCLGLLDDGSPFLTWVGQSFTSVSPKITDTNYHHFAVTKSGSVVIFYVDGVAYVAPSYNPPFSFGTPVTIGSVGGGGNSFLGLVDEISVFNRALSGAELQSIYNGSIAGKCTTGIAITSHPSNQSVSVGNNFSFAVVANGLPPTLSYQWRLNNTNLLGATNATLTVVNAQFTNAGNYSVLVTNTAGSTNSSNAVLTVNAATCVSPAPGLVGWWPAEGNGNDALGVLNGTLQNGVAFAPGKSGQAFSFNGINSVVSLGSPANLQSILTIEAWIKRGSTNQASLSGGGGGIFGYGFNGYFLGLMDDGSPFLSYVGPDVIGSQKITDTNFHHLAVTFGGGVVTFYVDGVASTVSPGGTFGLSGPVAIGATGGGANSFLGLIDEVSVYNRVLAGTEIQAIYNASAVGRCITPPVITNQPVPQVVTIGNNVQFNVGSAGLLLTYQWRLNGTNLPGATNATFSLANVQPTNAGNYSVTVSNTGGSTNSSNALLTLTGATCGGPASGLVSWWPGEGTPIDLASGNNGTLQGNATYVPGKVGQAFSFDGLGDQVNLGNPASLQLQNLTIEMWMRRSSVSNVTAGPDDAELVAYGNGGYGLGMSTDGTIFLTKTGISAVFSSQKITDTNFHHLAMTRNGSSVVFYVDGAAYPAAAFGDTFTFSTSLGIGSRGDGPSGFLGVIDEASIYNRALTGAEIQSIYNASSAGKCVGAPVITVQPVPQVVTFGNNATFSVGATGLLLNYQWRLNNTNVPGATNATLLLSNVQFSNAGNYSVTITNAAGSTNSSNALLTVNVANCVAPPSGLVGWWPGSGTPNDAAGTNNGTLQGNATYVTGRVAQAFTFDGSGDWVNLGNPIDLRLQDLSVEAWVRRGSTNQASLSAGGGGIFGYGNNGYLFGLLDDGTPFLTMVGVSQTSSSQKVTDMNYHHLAMTKSGSVVMFYVDGVADTAPAYNPTFSFGTSAAIGATGTGANSFIGLIDEVSVYNRALSGTEIQSIINASVAGKCPPPPVITTNPTNQTAPAGENAAFTVNASGVAPLAYQWFFNSSNIAGATNPVFVLTNAQIANAGSYSVRVTNPGGLTNSQSALLTVNSASPTIVTQPVGQVAPFNGSASLFAAAKGSEPLLYQWQFNNTNIGGATNQTLFLSNLQASNAGNYRVFVTNSYGGTNSSNATLVIANTFVVAWGYNGYGQTNVPLASAGAVSIAGGGYHSLVAKGDGTVVAWGNSANGQTTVPLAISNATGVAGGGLHSLALLTDGSTMGWGDNSSGQTNLQPALTNGKAIAAGYYHNLAIRSNGTVFSWGNNAGGQTNIPSGLSNVAAVAGGNLHSLALRSNGTVTAWGYNGFGQTNVPPGLSNIAAVSAGYYHSLALRSNGTVVAWGYNAYGQTNIPGGLSNVVAVSAGFYHNVALRSNGTVVVWGDNSQQQTNLPPGLSNVIAISGGGLHTLALLNTGAPAAVRQPRDTIAFTGDTVLFDVGVVSPGAVTYQWQFNGTNISGATNAALTLTNVPFSAQGQYRVVLSNIIGSGTSSNAFLTVLRSTPRFGTAPGDLQFTTNGFSMTLLGLSGHGPVVLYASTNLAGWQPILTNPPVLGSVILTDTNSVNFPTRYYRAEEQ